MSGESESIPTVRSASVDDAHAIARIYSHYVSAGGATFDAAEWNPHEVAELLRNRGPEIWCVLADRDHVLGWASARRFSLRHGYRLSLESAIYLAPDAVGRGFADALQLAVMNQSRDTEIHHLMARIIADNHRSIAFHHRHGFENVGIQREVGRMNDRWVDVAILQKIL